MVAGPCIAMPQDVAGTYERHKPETTLLHSIVREQFETLLAVARESDSDGLPGYVEQAFRKYLDCGVLACGFARARCKACGADIFVAFSCKQRGVCPSCGARRMANTGAHLVAHVLPDVAIRQWVFSMAFDLQFLLARNPRLLTAVLRIFVDVVSKWHKRHAEERGLQGAKTGAVSCVQRFGSTLNRHLHFHLLALDGVYVPGKKNESLVFHPSPNPTPDDVHALTVALLRRVRTLLKRLGIIGKEENPEKNPEPPTATAELNLAPGVFADIDSTGSILPSVPPSMRKRKAPVPNDDTCGFTIDASIRIPAGDFAGRERICRYVARHPFSLDRLSETADGRIAYKLKKPRQGKRFLVMAPLAFLRRLAFLVPPPFNPLVRYHGVLAPNSKWRGHVVRVSTGPKATRRTSDRCADSASSTASVPASVSTSACAPNSPVISPPAIPYAAISPIPHPAISSATLLPVVGAFLATTTSRLSRFEWATLLKRVYDVDALRCWRCDGRLDFIAVITEIDPIRAILTHLGLPCEPPKFTPARDPPSPGPPSFFDAHA